MDGLAGGGGRVHEGSLMLSRYLIEDQRDHFGQNGDRKRSIGRKKVTAF